MSDDRALYAAVCDNPDDDTVRVIYADWCEEYGQPDRAEFIRKQVEAAKLPQDDPKRVALELRANELLDKHQTEWTPRWPPECNTVAANFHRGFVDEVSMAASAYIEHHKALHLLAPVQSITLRGMNNDISTKSFQQLRDAMPPAVHTLNLADNLGFGGQRGLEKVGVIVTMHNLRTLNLRGNLIGNGTTGLTKVLGITSMRNLRTLDLTDNALGAGQESPGKIRWLAHGNMPHLTTLDVRGNHPNLDQFMNQFHVFLSQAYERTIDTDGQTGTMVSLRVLNGKPLPAHLEALRARAKTAYDKAQQATDAGKSPSPTTSRG